MSEPLVSVLIPLFNKEDYVETTLKSVFAQTYKNIEVIVIDDGSTDSGFSKVKDFLKTNKERFTKVVIDSRQNTGQTAARNEALSKASGEYAAFLDADDIWHPEKLADQVNFLQKNKKVDLVFCNYFMLFPSIFSNKAVKLKPIERKIESWLLTSGFGLALESTGLARISALKNYGGFDSRIQMCGGLDLAYKFFKDNKIGCLNRYLCGYRVIQEGWHSNKLDLIISYEELFKNRGLYAEVESRAKLNLKIHLALWSLREDQSLLNLRDFFKVALVFPYATLAYISATFLRVFMAQIRCWLYWREAKFFDSLAKS